MTLDTEKSIYFGQPLIDAYLLQEEVFFYGVVGHSSIEQIIKKSYPFLIKYPCYFKNCTSKHYTICPINTEVYDLTDIESISERNRLLKAVSKLREKTSGYLRKYIDNTEAYLSEVNALSKKE